ncbi:MAG: DNA polymerase III psi subunit [Paraglaciecola sp.]|jgi:DNA polymerase III psi subunit
MEHISRHVLSDYQRAILNELGISSWQLASDDQTQTKVDNQPHDVVKTSTRAISKDDALAKLKQLKAQTHTSEVTDSVLVTFLPSDKKCPIFSDVLIAIGLDVNPQKHISVDQLSHYSGYPFSWVQGQEVSMNRNQLITPALVELQHPDTKKQLWQQLQSALTLAKY